MAKEFITQAAKATAEAAHKAELQKDLDKALGQLAKAAGWVADKVTELGGATVAATAAERAAGGIAGEPGLELQAPGLAIRLDLLLMARGCRTADELNSFARGTGHDRTARADVALRAHRVTRDRLPSRRQRFGSRRPVQEEDRGRRCVAVMHRGESV